MKKILSEDLSNFSNIISDKKRGIKFNGTAQDIYYHYKPSFIPEDQAEIPAFIVEALRAVFSESFSLSSDMRDTYVFAYVYSGALLLSSNGNTSRFISSPCVLFLQNSSSFSLSQAEEIPLDILLIKCGGPLFERLMDILCERGSAAITLNAEENSAVSELLEQVISLIEPQTRINRLLISDKISHMLTYLYIELNSKLPQTHRQENTLNGYYPKWFALSQSFIYQNLDKSISVSQLSKLCEISEPQYYKKFKAITKTSPYQYILTLRLQKARTLLTTTKFQIKTIARTTGFKSSSHFSKHFQNQFGMLPKEYRKKYS